ncbi:2-oxoglutarate dehydrogenase complex dihydrolipoyllysine-residue succinyltransferase [Verrucomicrobiaceae bacterium N1E253]|uniref:Dihydrolipoyllysine-residue succinyltransferase n=1 Tax=Oceaniferula marina TaxID=2748318 RepID=A0A851GE62_9BACT|nr:2-oxoglutarate dehydrogenase complex dihydrolipoyllysine-residue succinyltransferase [Oceaniferula marina]NWK55449.1 2-oxoglutarate dehydrogenase complex dihydrolipoyllysine-residue succinyltransferase [Oceaniferula marina]
MATEVKIPNVGESITTANVARWHKQDGEHVAKGEIVLTIETDKVSNDLEADVSGTLKILVPEGEEVSIGSVVASIEEGAETPDAAADTAAPVAPAEPSEPAPSSDAKVIDIKVPAAGESITSANVGHWHVENGAQVTKGDVLVTLETDKVSNDLLADEDGVLNIIVPVGEEVGIGTIIASLTVGATSSAASKPATPAAAPAVSAAPTAASKPAASPAKTVTATPRPAASPSPTPAASIRPDASVTPSTSERSGQAQVEDDGRTTRRKMSMLRRKISTHLVSAQQTAAILTTFNEVDMTAIMELRKEVQNDFVAKHGCKLGFMSFFVKAVVQALKDVPAVNGRIEGNDIIENHFYDIGVAIGTEKGLVVPVLRDCEKKGFAEVEQDILDYAGKANDGSMELSDLQGGVFTISNGGVYGSLLSTPILNPPQSGILGMHTIQQRPVAVNGEVVIRPMMYLALSYDHRLVDGKEAVTFLIRIKDCLENPSRLMLEM